MTRHLLDPALDLVPLRRDGVVGRIRRYDTLCGLSVGLLDVARGLPNQTICPACEALAIAAGAEVA